MNESEFYRPMRWHAPHPDRPKEPLCGTVGEDGRPTHRVSTTLKTTCKRCIKAREKSIAAAQRRGLSRVTSMATSTTGERTMNEDLKALEDAPPLPEPAGNGIVVFGDEYQRDYTYPGDAYTEDQLTARDAEWQSRIRRVLDLLAVAQRENGRLKEDRLRFPDKPDDIGAMVGAHFKNLQAVAQSNEEAWRRAQAKLDIAAPDVHRLDWLLHNISGKELRRLGIKTSGGMNRALLDAAIDTRLNHQQGEQS